MNGGKMSDSFRDNNLRQSPYWGRGGNSPKHKNYGYSIQQTVEADFTKRKNLKNPSNRWLLPKPADVFKSDPWKNERMMSGKSELNEVKNRLSDFNLKDWHQHTRKTNHAGDVVSFVRKNIYPELLTQAWCKFFEIISSYNLISAEAVDSGCFNSLHLCEAPGAFITSLNHYLKLNFPDISWQWRASTLNPYYEGNKLSFMINDDRFILHSLDFWEFGRDQSGDMFKMENIDSLINVSKSMGPIHLVTADGSIDCQGDPGEQEAIVSPLHYHETLVALSVLSEGGSFVLKMFTMFESSTICLMYLLSCMFCIVDFFKPATSKEGNSEVYVICLQFYGPKVVEPYLDIFRKYFTHSDKKTMFSENQIPSDFFCEIIKCSDFFKDLQVTVLERNLRTYSEHNDRDEKQLYSLRKRLAHSYVERFSLKPIKNGFIVGNDTIRQTLTLNLDPRSEEFSFSNKMIQDANKIQNVLAGLKSMLELELMKPFNRPDESELSSCFNSDSLSKGLKLRLVPIFGCPVMTVYSSKFCLGSYLHVWNRLCEIKSANIHNAMDYDGEIERLLEHGLENENKRPKVCDMRRILYGGNVYIFEKECINRLINLLKTMNQREDLLLLGLPLLTRVSVGIVFYVTQAFEKVTFLNPLTTGYAVYFSSNRGTLPVLPDLYSLLQLMSKKNDLALHSFIPVTYLVKDPDWYKCILSTNHTLFKNVASDYIQNLLSVYST